VTHIALNGNQLSSEKDFHEVLSKELGFPTYYGNNLAALRDVLLSDDGRPIEIEWRHSGASKKKMGKDFSRIKSVLEDLTKERGNLQVRFL
jgi:ribonuclease inhibitor